MTLVPKTSSPAAKSVTSLPTASTITGEVATAHPVPRAAETEAEPREVGHAGHQVPDAGVDAGGVDPDQDVADAHGGQVDVVDPEDVGVAVRVLDEGLHGDHSESG